jgi:C-terminal processing protease CtpA/Prc
MVKLTLIFALSVTALANAVGQDTDSDLDPAQKIYGISNFWKEVSYNFAYFDQVPELDWDKAFEEYIPKVLETKSTFEYYRVLQRFCALLKDGHTGVSIPRAMRDRYWDRPQVILADLQRKPIVTNVAKNLSDKLPIGSEIREIDGRPFAAYMKEEILPYISSSTEHILWNDGIVRLLDGPIRSEVTVTALTPDGRTNSVTLTRASRGSNEPWLKDQPDRRLSEFRWIQGDIAYVAFNSFDDKKIVDEFRTMLPELYKAKGVVIDLRKNGGGSTWNGTAILDYFTKMPLSGSAWRTREHRASNKAWGKSDAERGDTTTLNYRYFKGEVWYRSFHDTLYPSQLAKIIVPTVVLIGYTTASAAEDFLIYADKVSHFTKVGQPTFGSTGQPLFFGLPGGGSARICTKRDTYPDGRDFVGVGVQPDVRVEATVEDFIQNRDRVLEKGIEVLKKKIAP